MNIGVANGKIFLLYKKAEKDNVESMRGTLASEGIIPIPCDDPANFRFVTPQVLLAAPENLDLIGRLALKHLGTYSAYDNFCNLKKELSTEDAV